MVDKIVGNHAVFDIVDDANGPGLVLTYMAPGVTVEELREKTEAEFAAQNESTKH